MKNFFANRLSLFLVITLIIISCPKEYLYEGGTDNSKSSIAIAGWQISAGNKYSYKQVWILDF